MSQIIRTRVEPRSSQFAKNRDSNLDRIETLGEAHKAAVAGGGAGCVSVSFAVPSSVPDRTVRHDRCGAGGAGGAWHRDERVSMTQRLKDLAVT